ncbi:MAG: DIP1984 family protein [Chloroflexota bacterium]|nr:DIP1984 family protein [Chloroflexota bacterium]
MKLAEALILRADLQKRVQQLKQRLLRNAKVQEGDNPSEDPQELIEELERVVAQLTQLVQRINKTNAVTVLEGRRTVSDSLAARDALGIRQGVYRELAQAASVTQERYSSSEVRLESTVNVADVQRRADALAQEYRELDSRIQETNWSTELSE